jgi:two-component system, LuxR family, response regulator FixJ
MRRQVHIVGVDAAERNTLRSLLNSAPFDVAVHTSARKFLDHAAAIGGSSGHCLVFGVRAPQMRELELLDELQRRQIDVPAIVVCRDGNISTVVRAMRGGAATFLQQPVNGPELIDALNEVFAHPQARAQTALEVHRAKLTPRQRDVFDLIRRGLRTKDIAKALGLSPRTVEVHRANLLERLGATNLTHLMGRLLEEPDEMR